jgi:hypothetical protein
MQMFIILLLIAVVVCGLAIEVIASSKKKAKDKANRVTSKSTFQTRQ